MLRLIVGLEDEYQGQVLLDGERIVGTSLRRGIVFQEHRLFPWLTVEGNIHLGLLNVDLVSKPEILLLDEPFGALDALTRAYLQQELHRIWQAEGITMILVTHDVEEAVYLGDKVVVMEPRPGRIRRIVPVDLAHPRERGDSSFASVKQRVLEEFSGDSESLAEPPLRPIHPVAVHVSEPLGHWQFAILI